MSSPIEVTLSATSPALSVTGLRGQTPAIVSGGGTGGWSTVARPRRKALTEWQGVDPIEITFSILFEGYATGRSVEPQCLSLERLGSPSSAGEQPPTIRVSGGIPHSDLDFIIESLEWDPAPIYALDGHRLRQEVTVKLLELVAADLVATPAQQAAAKASTATGGRTYVVRAGDTLLSIAAKLLGDYTRWQAIASLNGIRDPNRISVGMRLRLP